MNTNLGLMSLTWGGREGGIHDWVREKTEATLDVAMQLTTLVLSKSRKPCTVDSSRFNGPGPKEVKQTFQMLSYKFAKHNKHITSRTFD